MFHSTQRSKRIWFYLFPPVLVFAGVVFDQELNRDKKKHLALLAAAQIHAHGPTQWASLSAMADAPLVNLVKDKREIIGAGAFGIVKKAVDSSDGKPVALKLVERENPMIEDELRVLQRLREIGGHPHIVGFKGLASIPEDKKNFGLVFDLFSGGELYDSLAKNGAYSERMASQVIGQLASGLAFLHKNGIVHGDLKPENILLRSPGTEEFDVGICDFGSAVLMDETGHFSLPTSNEPMGTVSYSAPELLCGFAPVNPCDHIENCTAAVDMFSLGVILYVLLSGEFPFDPDNELKTDEEIARVVLRGKYDFDPDHNPVWRITSPCAKKLISKLLKKDPAQRLTAEQVLKSEWITNPQPCALLEGSDVRMGNYVRMQRKLQDHFFRLVMGDALKKRLSIPLDFQNEDGNDTRSYLQQVFKSKDPEGKGFITSKLLTDEDDEDEVDVGEVKIDYANLDNLLGCGVRETWKEGETVFKQGDVAKAFYFVDKGKALVFNDGNLIATIGPGEFFGETALFKKETRNATIVIGSPTAELICFDQAEFDRFLSEDEPRKLMADAIKLKTIDHIKGVFQDIYNNYPTVHVGNGTVLLRRGELSDAMYYILSGEVDVLDAEKHVVGKRKEGETVGELGLVTELPRTMDIVCSAPLGCALKKLDANDLKNLLATSL